MDTTQSLPDLLTVREVADLLRVPRARVYDLIRESRIPGTVRIGRQIRVDASALAEWIRSGGDRGP